MSLDEPIDQLTATGAFVGTTSRQVVHAAGLWHQVFHCLVIRNLDEPTVILQRRSASSRAFPHKLDLSATGHLLAGESPLDGVRELTEELGIEIDPAALVLVGTRLLADDDGEQQNRERVNVYFLADERPLTDYRPSVEEVQSLVEAPIEGLLALLSHQVDQVSAVEWRPGSDPDEVNISRSDVINQVDGYWQVLMIMASRFAEGKSPIAI